MLILFLGEPLSLNFFFILPAILLFAICTYACLIIFGVVGAYSRDFTFLMQSIVRFLFFTSPIIWYGDAGFRKVVSDYNPISYYLEVFRAPLSGHPPPTTAWLIVIGSTCAALLIAMYMQRTFRQRLIFWL